MVRKKPNPAQPEPNRVFVDLSTQRSRAGWGETFPRVLVLSQEQERPRMRVLLNTSKQDRVYFFMLFVYKHRLSFWASFKRLEPWPC